MVEIRETAREGRRGHFCNHFKNPLSFRIKFKLLLVSFAEATNNPKSSVLTKKGWFVTQVLWQLWVIRQSTLDWLCGLSPFQDPRKGDSASPMAMTEDVQLSCKKGKEELGAIIKSIMAFTSYSAASLLHTSWYMMCMRSAGILPLNTTWSHRLHTSFLNGK